MGKVNISEDVINEVEGLVDIGNHKIEQIESSVIFDGKQYTLKIPKKIAERVGIDHSKDKFIFEVVTYPIEEKKIPELTIRLKRGEQ